MDLRMLERAAMIVFEMCRQHPEICPHDYEWYWTSAPDENGNRTEHYTCNLCGDEYERVKNSKGEVIRYEYKNRNN